MLVRTIVFLAIGFATAAGLAACDMGLGPIPTPRTTTPALTTPALTIPAPQATRTVAPAVTLSVGPGPEGPTQMATVDKITDGDTIHVNIDGKDFTLRYIGMNAPESVDPNKPVEPGGPEASVANKDLVSGQTVYLEKDVSNTDRFGRLLRYVWLNTNTGWVMVDRQLVLEGWAEARDYPPDTKYHDTLFEAQDEAQAAGLGIWSAAFQSPLPTDGGVHLLNPPSAAPSCDPSYPTICLPPPPPDLNCRDIPYRQFPVLQPDDHHFDGDHDGIGCEPTPAP
jgi:micrococcal nuclease